MFFIHFHTGLVIYPCSVWIFTLRQREHDYKNKVNAKSKFYHYLQAIRQHTVCNLLFCEFIQRFHFAIFFILSRWIGILLEFLGNILILAASIFALVTNGLSGAEVGLSISYALQVEWLKSSIRIGDRSTGWTT